MKRKFLLSALKIIIVLLLADINLAVMAQDSGNFEIARIKYRGGGDWYNDPSALTNLIEFASERVSLPLEIKYKDVAIGSSELFSYPFAFLTGHGNIDVNESEARNMRKYLENGGFLYIDDDYGLDKYARAMMKKVFPDEEMIEIPFSHPIYHQLYNFPDGLPKVHEHDNKPPQGFGIFRKGKLVMFYTYESNLADGWTDPEVHNPPASLREKSLQMGANILIYALTNF